MFEDAQRVNVVQCTHAVSGEDNVVLSAVLGSCIAVCAFDDWAGIGGMNHILLPGAGDGGINGQSGMYGTNLMELLLNDLYKQGARRRNLKLKLFGGAKMLTAGKSAGQRNIDFISEFCTNEELNVLSASVGGTQGRRVEFHPKSGKSRQRLLVDTQIDEKPIHVPPVATQSDDLELF